MIEHRIYFGTASWGSSNVVPIWEFRKFIKEEVVPRFQGFTVLTGMGYWQGKRELTRILTVVVDENDPHSLVIDIIDAYAKRFNQDSVLHTWHNVGSALVVTNRV